MPPPIDAELIPEDGIVIGCTMPAVSTDFAGAANPCEPIGAIVGTPPTYAEIYLESGRLIIEPPPNLARANGCRNGAPMSFEQGIFVEIQSAFAHPNSFVVLTYNSPVPSTAAIAGFRTNGTNVYLTGMGASQNEVLLDSTSRWWRLRPGTGEIIGEVSPDGHRWRRIGRVPGTPPQEIVLYVAGGILDDLAETPGRAEIEQVNVCPP